LEVYHAIATRWSVVHFSVSQLLILFFFNQSNSHPALDNIFSEAHIKANNIPKQIPP